MDYLQNVIFGHLKVNSLRNKFEPISELIKVQIDIFLINETKLDVLFPSNQYAISASKYIIKTEKKMEEGGVELIFILMINGKTGL